MSTYKGLFDEKETPIPDKPKDDKKKKFVRGCQDCTLNTEGCVKVIGLSRIAGKKVFVWAQNPGRDEVRHIYEDADGKKRRGMELIGPSGKFFWREMAAVGLHREDCDIQNVVRCRPTQWNDGREFDRKPSKDEIKHCSLYSDKAIEKNAGTAKVHIVLGLVAAGALLGKEFKKDQLVFWSDRLKAKVICIPHPAYFLRDGYAKSKLKQFREGLKAAVEILKGKGSRFAFVEAQDFKAIKRASTFAEFAAILKEHSKKERVIFDIEDGPRNGGRVILCIGFSFRPGMARTVYLDKSDVQIDDRPQFMNIFEQIFTDPNIRFGAHHSVHDAPGIKKLMGIKIANLDFDTEYAEYIRYSNRRSYSLAEIAEVRFPKYAGYKDIIKQYITTDKKGWDPDRNFDNIPYKIMTIYNGADCSLAKEIERSTGPKVNMALLHVYMDAAFIIDRMQQVGPKLDYKYYDVVEAILPHKVKRLQQELAVMAGNPDFNPGSVTQVRPFLYEILELEEVINKKGKLATDAHALEYLKQFHPAPAIIDQYRKLSKMNSTYLKGFKNSADIHGGELRTTWWLTGTVTGRLRSGGGDKDKKSGEKKDSRGIVNLQNIHGDEVIQNLLVSDLHWRKVLKLIDEDPELKERIDEAVQAARDKRNGKS